MNKISIQYIGVLTVFLFITSCSKSLVYNSVKDSSQCAKKNGYWYNNKCWKDYEDEGIPKSEIDSIVSAQIKIINDSKITLDNATHPLVAFMPIEEKDGLVLITVYGTKENYKTLLFPTGKKQIKKENIKTPAILIDGNILADDIDIESKLTGTATINIIDLENFDLEINGEILTEDNVSKSFSFKPTEAISGAGTSQLEVKGNEAYLSGDLGIITYRQIKELIKNHPEVKTIVMTQISGSVNDAVNMHTGRILRENGFTTKVLSNSDIASGGVDLFCAGKKRIVEKGAKIGVHSWCCVNDLTAVEIPKDHPAHQYQLAYFTMALGPEIGPDFYFYTLEASPFDNVHYMTDEEIKKWNIATTFIEK